MTQFVNPYTFVPLVKTIERGKPSGHDAMGRGNLSGFLNIRLTAKTPLLIGGYGTADRPDVPRRASDNQPVIPGSGLLGAVRSVHEALAGGCMRVLDADRVPVHRHPAHPRETSGLRLAVVSHVEKRAGEERQQVTVRLCDESVMIPRALLPAGELPRTGDQLQYPPGRDGVTSFPALATLGAGDRKVLRVGSDAHPDGLEPGSISRKARLGPIRDDCWVLLVSDTKARSKEPVRFAAGRVGPSSQAYVVSDSVMEKYAKTVAGADDLRTAKLIAAGATDGNESTDVPDKPEYADVEWPIGSGQAVAERLCARSYLHVGQPVWVRLSEPVQGARAEVSEVRLSVLWRYQRGSSVGDRVGQAMPCAHYERLCWSCRLFGSADTEGREDDDLAVQQSYRGHVRVNDLIADGTFEPLIWRLAPLASPKPSAGQFYLDHSEPGRRLTADKDTPAAATWGSLADKPRARPVRGRKFYWRTETPGEEPPVGQHARWKRRRHQSEAMGGDVALVPAGQVFRGRVAFDNLSLADLGSLIAALDPRQLRHADDDVRAADWDKTVTSVGGGKPFGFGAVTIEVESVTAQTAVERYRGAPHASVGSTQAVREFLNDVPATVRSTWAALRNVLTFGYVKDELVWYPPGRGARGTEDYDKSFEFFAKTNGLTLASETRELVVLPDAAASPAGQVLDSEGRVRRHERRG